MRTIKMSESEYAELSEEYCGACLACGAIQYGGCEPDARNYLCENCGKREVYGLEELLMMGALEFSE